MKKLICLILCLCLCLCGCGKEDSESRDFVSVWYITGQEPKGLETLVNEYNKSRPDGCLPVSLRAFPHEQALAAAFELRGPDLLLCYHGRAMQLYEQGVLTEVGAKAPVYNGGIRESFEFAGKSFFPIGSELQLLCENEALLAEESLKNFELFCRSAMEYSMENKKPAFTADDFSALFCHELLCMDTQFHGKLETDKNNELFRYLYNLLTEAAMEGALLSTEYASVDIILDNALPYAMANSRSLVYAKDRQVYPMPSFRDSLAYPAQCLGIAVTAGQGRSPESIASFLDYVNRSENSAALALASGLAPAVENQTEGENSLESCLLEIGAYYEPYFPLDSSDYIKNRLSFEAVFRNTLNRLY